MSDDEEFSLLKRSGRREQKPVNSFRAPSGGVLQDIHADYFSVKRMAEQGDPYLRDELGRPIDLLRSAPARRRRAEPVTGLRKFFILGGVFAGFLALSGELIPAAVVAGSTLFLVIVSRLRR
ncbi:MAG: hypothetical protein QXJ55_08200 [Candidatus Caldarchaeum sp.]